MVGGGILGSILFTFGLFFIVQYGLSLYTGKLGYTFSNPPRYVIDTLIPTLVGNFSGTLLCSLLLRATKIFDKIQSAAAQIWQAKIDDSLVSSFVLAFFCGLLMYLAVDNSRAAQGIMKLYGIIIPVVVFIMCGFNHSIADSFYFWTANIFNLRSVVYLGIVIVGNFLGGITFPLVIKTDRK